MEYDMSVCFSIVIPTFNEEQNINNVLKSILRLNKENFSIEIIIVDNGSIDETVTIARKYTDRVFICPGYTISELRNYGVSRSQGAYIGFVDADCVLCPDWAIIAKKILDKEINTGIVGSFYATSENPSWVEKLWCAMRKDSTKKVNFLPAGNCAVRKNEFEKMGGFNSNLQTSEDYDLCLKYKKNGFVVRNVPAMVSQHAGNAKNLIEIFKGELWYGQTMLESLRSGNLSKPIIACFFILLGLFLVTYFITAKLINISSSNLILVIGIVLFIAPCLTYAFIASRRSGNKKYFFPYILIFFFYLSGRMFSLYYAFTGKYKKTK